ncbi:hypothetical protein [Novosphingobium sp.]|uniref:hypothetical protein n=1 Tax=Novosphingobium sp. TaxID=1874826 RepID=UPI0035B48350
MILDDEDLAQIPHRLFAMAGRRLEGSVRIAGTGESREQGQQALQALAGELYDCGQDLMTIADAIVAVTMARTAP